MLVLSRKVGEKIRIGQDIEIRVIAIVGNRVRLGISAPTEMPVFRSELLVRKGAPKAGAMTVGQNSS